MPQGEENLRQPSAFDHSAKTDQAEVCHEPHMSYQFGINIYCDDQSTYLKRFIVYVRTRIECHHSHQDGVYDKSAVRT